MKKENQGIDKLFEALKNLSENGGQIHIGSIGDMDNIPDELKDILGKLGVQKKRSPNQKNTDGDKSGTGSLLDMLSGNDSVVDEKARQAKEIMAALSEEERIAKYTMTMLSGAVEMEVDHDILMCNFLNILSAEKLSDEMIENDEMKDPSQLMDNMISITARFDGKSANNRSLPEHTVKAMELGDSIFSSLLNNRNLTKSDKIVALALALNHLIKNEKLNR